MSVRPSFGFSLYISFRLSFISAWFCTCTYFGFVYVSVRLLFKTCTCSGLVSTSLQSTFLYVFLCFGSAYVLVWSIYRFGLLFYNTFMSRFDLDYNSAFISARPRYRFDLFSNTHIFWLGLFLYTLMFQLYLYVGWVDILVNVQGIFWFGPCFSPAYVSVRSIFRFGLYFYSTVVSVRSVFGLSYLIYYHISFDVCYRVGSIQVFVKCVLCFGSTLRFRYVTFRACPFTWWCHPIPAKTPAPPHPRRPTCKHTAAGPPPDHSPPLRRRTRTGTWHQQMCNGVNSCRVWEKKKTEKRREKKYLLMFSVRAP